MEVQAGGQLRKMHARLDDPVSYSFSLDGQLTPLNPLLKKQIKLVHTGKITCIHCGRETAKSFNQGYCYPCFQKLAQCDSCIMSPEKCHYDAGTCREPVWGEEFCMQDHIVYLANSSGIKVGITRASQIPVRWMDQGAVQALAIMRVRSRQQSGYAETVFRQHISDRTNWRTMLKGETEEIDLVAEKNRLMEECSNDIRDLQERFGVHAIASLVGVKPVDITYPVINHPDKVSVFNFDKEAVAEGTLLGIKGQYLIFDTGVVNIRKYNGYHIELHY